MHATAYRSLDARRATRELEATIIDGQAWIVSGGPTGRIAGSKAEPDGTAPSAASSAGALAAFAARRRRRAAADLLFQGAAAQARSPSPEARPPSAPATRRYAGFAAVGAFAILPVLLFAQPEQPVAAPIETTTSSSRALTPERAGLVIADLKSGITRRGGGDVLVLEGIVHNISAMPAVLPPILVTLTSDAGSRLSKPLALKPGTLAPGQSIGFHSTVAVAAGTKSDVVVAFLPSDTRESASQ